MKALFTFIVLVFLGLNVSHGQPIVKGSDGVDVTVEDVVAQLRQSPADIRLRLAHDPQRLSQIVRSLYIEKRLANEAELRGFDQEPEVQMALASAHRKALANMMLDRLVQEAMPESVERAAREHYQLNLSDYQRPAQVSASHILISEAERSPEEAKQLAERLYAKVKAEPGKLETLAAEYSDDPSAATNNGNLGWFGAEEMVAPFSEAAFNLKEINAVSQPVKSRFGWHVIRLDERRDAQQLSFEQVQGSIERDLRTQRRRAIREELTSHYAADEGAELFPEQLEKIADALAEQEQSD